MKTIIVVEDEKTILEFYQLVLLEAQHQVITAQNGKEALDHIQKYKADLLILDLCIPIISGRNLLASIKKIDKYLPIIIITGKKNLKEDPEVQFSSQIARFLYKPVSKEELMQSVENVLLETAHRNLAQKIFADCYLESLIEMGGSGVVYRGKYQDQTVAVKVLPPLSTMDETQRKRFQREAQTIPQMRHPNIIEIIKIGYEQDMPYIVMHFFNGCTVQKILTREGIISLQEAKEILLQVVEGMRFLHEKGIIHRDIKPSNLLYNRQTKEVKIIDFGIARPIWNDQMVTSQHQIVGTPDYMSPEQCQNKILEVGSDIYNLGVTFYQMITGILPFSKKNSLRTMLAHVNDSLSWPTTTTQNISIAYQQVITKMLAKTRQDRYVSMDQVKEALLML